MRTSETYEQSYAGNNSTATSYPITFQFRDSEDLEVMVTTSAGIQSVLAPGGYTVTRDSVTELGSFVTAIAIPVSSTVKIYRNNRLLQEHDYANSDTFPADSHEAAMDRLTEGLQSVRAMAARALRVSAANAAIDSATSEINTVAGIGSVGEFVFRSSAELLSFLALTAPIINQPTKTWLNNGERALAVPDFLGQLGTQRDTMVTYLSFGLAAGNWTPTTSGGVSDGAITTAKLADGALSADAAGRAKMASLYLMLSHMNTDFITAMTAKALLEDGDYLAGWSAADSAFRKFAGNVAVPTGSIIQTVAATPYTANTNIMTVIPNDDTIPQITEGTQILDLSITPRFSDSRISLSFHGDYAIAAGGAAATLFRNPITNALKTAWSNVGSSTLAELNLIHFDSPATTSAIIYTIRAGPRSAGTLRFNGNPTARFMGGTLGATLIAQEIKV